MPKFNRRRRPAQARRPRRAKRARGYTTSPRGLNPISPRYICKMKYSTTLTTDLSGQTIFRLNGLFNPTLSSTTAGHQPYGYDQLEGLYNRYRVISCGWRIERAMLDNSNPILLGCIPSNDPNIEWNSAGGFSALRENPRSRYITQNAGAGVKVLSGKQYLPALMGRSKTAYMGDDHLQATVNTLPVEQALLYVLTYNTNNTPAPSTSINCLLEFTVEWFDQKRQIQSQI